MGTIPPQLTPHSVHLRVRLTLLLVYARIVCGQRRRVDKTNGLLLAHVVENWPVVKRRFHRYRGQRNLDRTSTFYGRQCRSEGKTV